MPLRYGSDSLKQDRIRDSFLAKRCAHRKAGTATNSRLWNWLAVPGLPTPS